MDPASQMTLQLLMRTLTRINADDLAAIRTETLSQVLSILLQLAERISDVLDDRHESRRS